ncbi:hypothetical protein CCAE64S_02869 [Castellaniella caeni]
MKSWSAPPADAQVVAKLPIVEVVQAPLPWPGVGRDLVALEACRRGQLGHAILHGGAQFVAGHGRRKLGEYGVWLQCEVVERQVLRAKGDGLTHVLLALRQRLLRQGEHQIQIDTIHGALRHADGGTRLGGVVDAAQAAQFVIVEALDAQ